MMAAQERIEAIRTIYNNAAYNEPNDLAAAQTPAQVTAIQENVAKARAIYFAAIADGLTANGDDVEEAYALAVEAEETVRKARDSSSAVTDLLNKLRTATSAAGNLLQKASH